MRALAALLAIPLAVILAGCVQSPTSVTAIQPIIDVHRHTPWPGDDDESALAQIHGEMAADNVVTSVLFITGTEDVAKYSNSEGRRFLLSPMFPCPHLTAGRKWCFTDTDGVLPDLAWMERELAAGRLHGIGELVFSYAGIDPRDPVMSPYWELAARYDVPAFVHTGRGPGEGQGPRRHAGCCPDYQADFGNPALLTPILERHPGLRLSLQHAGFDYMDETLALLRAYPNVYLDMSVLNSVGPEALYEQSLRRLVEKGFADRIMLGSDDLPYAPIRARIDAADFLTAEQRRGIYYDNAARFLRLERDGRDGL
jgi:hypothetical protein